jgi:hypothetical protein
MQNPLLVEKAVQKARVLLEKGAWPSDMIAALEMKFSSIIKKLDFVRLQQGLAIFVSPTIAKLFLLPFPVKERVVAGASFEIRDILYYMQFLKPYYLLTISKKRIRLFHGSGYELKEMSNDDFPKQYVEEWEYAPPSPASSSSPALKSFERDKSVLSETRLTEFLRGADRALRKYLKGDVALLVAGVGEEVALFEQVTSHSSRLSGTIAGNYDIDAVFPLAEVAWKKIQEGVRKSQLELLSHAQEEFGSGRLSSGVVDVWREAHRGNGRTLLVERDYEMPGYFDPGIQSELLLQRPGASSQFVPDVADEIIELVRKKGGSISIFENGELEKYGHIALLLRYAI